METLLRELRYGLRTLTKSPGFAVIAVFTLALGIGASTAIFSVVDAVLLRALPYPNPQKIVRVWEQTPDGHRMQRRGSKFRRFPLPRTIRSRIWRNMAWTVALFPAAASRCASTSPKSPAASLKSLGVEPFRGRAFAPEEQRLHGAPAAIVSYSYWQRYLGGATDLSKFHLRMEGAVYPVAGVMPEGFDFPAGVAAWIPREADPEPSRTAHNWQAARPHPRWGYRRPGARESQHHRSPHQKSVRKRC